MGQKDIDFALDITSREGWGFLRHDIGRLLSLTPNGSFIARVDGQRAGLLTTVCHMKCCWIGNVAVAPRFRHRGIGRLLVRSALGLARARDMERTALVCRQELVGFYRGLGFLAGRAIVGMSGTPKTSQIQGRDISVVPVTPAILPQVIRLDSASCGDNRAAMLARFLRDMRGSFLVHLDKGKVDGFIVGKPGSNSMEIGPWTVRRGRERAARALFLSLLSNISGPVELYVHAHQRWALELLQESGLKKGNRFLEMYIGGPRRPSKGARMLALAGLEKG